MKQVASSRAQHQPRRRVTVVAAAAPAEATTTATTRWLAENLDAPWLRVIDVRVGSKSSSPLRRQISPPTPEESGVLPKSTDHHLNIEDPPRFVEIGPHVGWVRAGEWAPRRAPVSSAFVNGHIPGSTYLDVASKLFDSSGSLVWAPEIAMVMSTLGVGDEHTIVLVDEESPSAALVLAWALRHHGHHKTLILSGGFPRWVAEHRVVTTEIVKRPFASFTARLA